MWRIALAVALVLTNAFFVAAEFALVQARLTWLDLRAEEGVKSAATARAMVERLDRILPATQLGVTLASLALGWVGEPAFAFVAAPLLRALALPAAVTDEIGLVVGFVVVTFLHIVFGELAPKGLAIARAERVALFVAPPLRVFMTVCRPALWVLEASSNQVLRLVGIRPEDIAEEALPAEELREMAATSAAEGAIPAGQGRLLERVFTFSGRDARDIMVPRRKIKAIDVHWPIERALAYAFENGHSRYPMYEGDLDGVIGVLHMRDVMPRLDRCDDMGRLLELARPPMFVPETVAANRLLRAFQRQHSHLAIVLDEFGSVSGLVTLEDTLEELVGEIQDETDEERAGVEPLDGGGWSVEGGLLLADLADVLGGRPFQSEASTLSGLIMERLGRVAQVGDEVDLVDGWRARVVAMDRRAIDRVEIRQAAPEVSAPT